MEYIGTYNSPLGNIYLTSSNKGLTGLWLNSQRDREEFSKRDYINEENEYIKLAKQWLDIYFIGEKPNIKIPLDLAGSDFQKEVWKILLTIPYGKTSTYGDIAKQIAKKRGIKRMSAQAVGRSSRAQSNINYNSLS